jgi:anthranilate 1,2-dioxygenase large subunit
MTRHRLRQGNLMGPSGFLGLEDNEAIKFVQEGVRRSPTDLGIVKLGGTSEGTSTTLISESAIRAMYRHYREVMSL